MKGEGVTKDILFRLRHKSLQLVLFLISAFSEKAIATSMFYLVFSCLRIIQLLRKCHGTDYQVALFVSLKQDSF